MIASSKIWDPNLVNKIKLQLNTEVIEVNKKEDLTIQLIQKFNPKLIFFPHWSYIIPDEIYSKYPCIVFHMTDLPFGRGGSPLQNLIQRGYKKTKLSAISVVKELDAGDIYLKEELSLSGTAQEIFERATAIIEKMMIKIVSEDINPVPQEGEPVIFQRRTPDQSRIKNINQIEKLFDHIRMLDGEGYPKAFIEYEDYRIEFSGSELNGSKIDAKVSITKKKIS